MRRARAVLFVCAVFVCALVSGKTPLANHTAADPLTFQCHWDASCPDITVAGDPLATIGGGPSPFRGYGDPSLERDPATGTIWMTYSWLEVLVSDPGPPPTVDFGVSTHLARSDDGGHTFTFVRALNSAQLIQHPDTAEQGWASHEVSTITARPDGWEALWLTYFDPLGAPGYKDVYYTRSIAATPGGLGDTSEPWIDGYATPPSWGTQYDLSATIPQLSDCAVFTEPALITHNGATYLATNCLVLIGGVRHPELERLVLLRENADGSYLYVGTLLDYQDAVDNGGDRIEQADLAVAQNGAVLLIATPITDSPTTKHLGCKVFEVSDLGTAQVRRGAGGQATVLASIDGDDPTLGAGLCTYDAASATGVVIVLHDYSASPFDMLFSMRATGVHPQGLDSDGDGRADSADNCPSWPNPSQNLPPWQVPAGDSDCDGYPGTQATAGKAPESFIGTNPAAKCAATMVANDEGGADAWPVDYNDDQRANMLDISTFSSHFGSQLSPPIGNYGVRWDLNGDSKVNILDISQYSSFFMKSCAP